MKILYISNSIIPSKTANSINVMKMCEGFVDNSEDKESCFSNCLDEIKQEKIWKIIPLILNENI